MYRLMHIFITGAILYAITCFEIMAAARRLHHHQAAQMPTGTADQSLTPQVKTAKDIVYESYNATFSHLEQCGDRATMQGCALNLYRSLSKNDNMPWWFHTMLRDVSRSKEQGDGINAFWHFLSTPSINVRMCAIEKVSSKQWQPEYQIAETAPRFVFLRDPLERFLSAFVDNCLSSRRKDERDCEPNSIFADDNNHGFEANKKVFFEAYVDSMPLKWNVHFFPQR